MSIPFSFSSISPLNLKWYPYFADPKMNCQESSLVVARILLFDPDLLEIRFKKLKLL